MTAIATELAPPIRAYVHRFVMRGRMQRVVRAGGRAMLFALVWMLICCGVDRFVALPGEMRLALLMINVGVACAIILDAALTLGRAVDLPAAAREIERREPAFEQRLATVVSRMLGPAAQRGSAGMLEELAAQVRAATEARDPAALLPAGMALQPWAVVAAILIAAAALTAAPIIGLPQLVRRHVMPLASLPPVSTTELIVFPPLADVVEGEPLRVRATARRLGDGGLTLHVRRGGGSWTERPMRVSPDGGFEFSIADVRQELEYFVSGGDASSAVFRPRIARKPAVEEFRIRYTYPAYFALPQRGASDHEGHIEAPIGTDADVTVVASEPLSSATLMVGAEAIAMSSTADPRRRTATIRVQRDQRFNVRMISAHGVEAVFRGGSIRAIADRAPVVRVDSATLAGKALSVAYEAADDVGLRSLVISVRRGVRQTPRDYDVPIVGDARQQRGVHRIDLSPLRVRAGDALRVQVRAEDGAGGRSTATAAVGSTDSSAAPAAGATNDPGGTLKRAGSAAVEPVADPPAFRDALDAYFRAIERREKP